MPESSENQMEIKYQSNMPPKNQVALDNLIK